MKKTGFFLACVKKRLADEICAIEPRNQIDHISIEDEPFVLLLISEAELDREYRGFRVLIRQSQPYQKPLFIEKFLLIYFKFSLSKSAT